MSTEQLLEKIEPNLFNPNSMGDVYKDLLEDMKENGPQTIDPIIVSPKGSFYQDTSLSDDDFVIIDGFHRWKAAKELGWNKIPAKVMVIAEPEAKVYNYRKNRERGTLDAFKEGELFISETGLTQEEIGEKYGVNRSYVSRRMKLAGFKPEVTKIIETRREAFKKELKTMQEDEPNEDHAYNIKYKQERIEAIESNIKSLEDNVRRRTLTPSHLQEIMVLKTPGKRSEAINRVLTTNSSVANTRERVEKLKRQEEKEEALRKAVKDSDHKVCPECGAEPMESSYKGLPWVRCKGVKGSWMRHEWSLKSGLTADQYKKQERNKYLKEHPEEVTKEKTKDREKFKPKSFRYPMTKEEINLQLSKRIIKAVAKLESLESIDVRGYNEKGECISYDLNSYSYSEDISKKKKPSDSWWEREKISGVNFNLETKEWKTDQVNKVKVNCHTSDEAELKRIRDFLDQL